MKIFNLVLILFFLLSCSESPKQIEKSATASNKSSIFILGTIQDAGSPHIACTKDCCKDLFDNPDKSRKVVSLGIYDASTKKRYLFEATPDMPSQLKYLMNFGSNSNKEVPEGIFLTHAHIGHYTGLCIWERKQ
jgi:pyrroloquinoline quinone biosynthesis protein B